MIQVKIIDMKDIPQNITGESLVIWMLEKRTLFR